VNGNEKCTDVDQGHGEVVTATVGGMTSLLALFVGVGITADRMAVIFNGGTARTQIIVALMLAVVSIGLGLATVVLVRKTPWQVLSALAAIGALLVSLVFGVLAASSSFSDGGRPTFTKISLVSNGDAHATLSFTIMATGVKHDNLLRVFASWLPVVADPASPGTAPTPNSQPPFYVATLRPDDKGVVSQEVTVLLVRQSNARYLRLQVYWDSFAGLTPTPSEAALRSTPTAIPTMERVFPPVPYGAQCGSQANAKLAAACVDVLLAAAASPAPS
jgi:hypothetical protein